MNMQLTDLREFQNLRAVMSTIFHAAMLVKANGGPEPASRLAIDHADAHLELLGIVDPDKCAA